MQTRRLCTAEYVLVLKDEPPQHHMLCYPAIGTGNNWLFVDGRRDHLKQRNPVDEIVGFSEASCISLGVAMADYEGRAAAQSISSDSGTGFVFKRVLSRFCSFTLFVRAPRRRTSVFWASYQGANRDAVVKNFLSCIKKQTFLNSHYLPSLFPSFLRKVMPSHSFSSLSYLEVANSHPFPAIFAHITFEN